jgi:hypothetical protein
MFKGSASRDMYNLGKYFLHVCLFLDSFLFASVNFYFFQKLKTLKLVLNQKVPKNLFTATAFRE